MTTDERPMTRITSLSPEDAAAADAVLASRALGSDAAGPVPAGLSERAEAVRVLLGTLEAGWVAEDPADDLADRAVQRMIDERQRRRFSLQIAQAAGSGMHRGRGGFGGFQWRQITTAAAMVLIALGLLLPVLNRVRTGSQQAQCGNNLATAGIGFGGFAQDHNDALPRYQPGEVWWKIGRPTSVSHDGRSESNSANLYLLIRKGYTSPRELACPENPHANPATLTADHADWPTPESVSFSYQNQTTPKPIRLTAVPLIPLLADRNPLFVVKGERLGKASCGDAAPSRSHGQRGQNILFSDGRVTWTLGPRLQRLGGGQDNIWTMAHVPTRRVSGDEAAPDPALDSFLSP